MHTPQERDKKNKRMQRDENAVKRQVKIARQKGLTDQDQAIMQPNRLSKHHAMDCGRPGCMMCGNPRKIFNELTAQEKRLFQDLDDTRDRHCNGSSTDHNENQ
jgi:hypothetical protein